MLEGGEGELVLGNGRSRSTHEGVREAWHEGVRTGCMGSCILGSNVPRCNRRHLGERAAGRGSCEGGRLVKSLESMSRALGGNAQGGAAEGSVHPRVHHCTFGSKYQSLAQGQAHRELARGEERGAPAEPKEHMKRLGGVRGRRRLGDG